MAVLQKITVFLSSPGDVQPEHDLAKAIVERIAGEFAEVADISAISWVDEPTSATSTFQDSLPRPSEVADIVVCLFWLRLGTPLPLSRFQRPDGSAYESGTVFELEDALAAHGASGKPETLIYRKVAEPRFAARTPAELPPHIAQWTALNAYLGRLTTNEDGSNARAAREFRTEEELSGLLEQHLRKIVAGLRQSRTTNPASCTPRSAWLAESPFRGLEPFDFEHADIFHGRARPAVEIKARIVQRQEKERLPFLLVYGASGVGKSSLMRAGVMPRLVRPGAVPGITAWRRCSFIVGARPLHDLLTALSGPTALPEIAAGVASIEKLEAALLEAPGMAPSLLLQQVMAGMPTERRNIRLVILVDQAEALFTAQTTRSAEVASFVTCLEALARSGYVWVLMTMRADFFHRCVEISGLAELRSGAGHYELLPPGPAELAQIIRTPAIAAGLTFEDTPSKGDLADLLLADALRLGSPLPLLEFTLSRLYSSDRDGRVLRFSTYHSLGGIAGAFNTYAEEQIECLPEAEQQALPLLLERLVALDEKEEARPVARDMLYEPSDMDATERALLEALVAARLVTSSERGGTVIMRLVHESILTSWSRAERWIEQNGIFLIKLRRLERAARVRADDPSFFLTGQALREALDLTENHGKVLTSAVRDLVAASRQAEEDALTEAARNEVERLQQKVRQSRSRLRLLGFVTALVMVLCATIFLYLRQANETLYAERDGEAARAQARAIENLSEGRFDQAIRNVLEAPASRRPELDEQLERALARAVVRHPRARLALVTGGEQVISHDQTSAGSIFASGSADGTVRVWNMATQQTLAVLRDDDLKVTNVALSASGDIVAAASNKAIVVWDVGTRTRLARLERSTATTILRISPKGTLVAAGSADGGTIVWDYTSPAPPRALSRLPDAVSALNFSSDAAQIAAGAVGNVLVAGVSDLRARTLEIGGEIVDLSFADGDKSILVASVDGSGVVSLLPLEDQGKVWKVTLSDRPLKVELGPGGNRLLTVDTANELTVWARDGDTPIASLPPVDAIKDAVFQDRDDEIAWIAETSLHRAEISAALHSPQPIGTPVDLSQQSGSTPANPVNLRFDPRTNTLAVVTDNGAGFLLSSQDPAQIKTVGFLEEEAVVVPCRHAGLIARAAREKNGWAFSLIDAKDGSTLVRWTQPADSAADQLARTRTCLGVAFEERPDGTLAAVRTDGGQSVADLIGQAETEEQVMAAKSADGRLRVWRLADGKELVLGQTFRAPDTGQVAAADGLFAIGDPAVPLVSVFDAATGARIPVENSDIAGVVSVSRTGLAVVDAGGGVRLWRRTDAGFQPVELGTGSTIGLVHDVALGENIAILSTTRGSITADWRDAQHVKLQHLDNDQSIQSVALDGARWFAAKADGFIVVRELGTNEKLDEFQTFNSDSPLDGVVYLSLDGRLIVWNKRGEIWSNSVPVRDRLKATACELVEPSLQVGDCVSRRS